MSVEHHPLGIDPAQAPIPVLPTAHYAMGGIPTDIHGRVICDAAGTVVNGLYAAGECACVSVHGANRLGTNSLLDLVVFGRRAGRHIGDYVGQADLPDVTPADADAARTWIARLTDGRPGPHGGHLTEEMQLQMMEKVGIYRNAGDMQAAIEIIQGLREAYKTVRVQDTGKKFNTDLLDIIELGNLLDLSLVTAAAALNRRESRGAHSREDYPERDDVTWLKHSLTYLEGDTVRIDYKKVDTSLWEPKPRTY
jgi:succinate dehydrogenase / fumarate reductase, flavoprotein subunit